jgi:hypothetical protein
VSIEALPCLVCGKRLVNVWQDADNQPNDGVTWISHGNYGSTVYDPVGTEEFIEMNLCDECLVRAGEQGRIYTARQRRPVHMHDYGIVGSISAPYAPVPWHRGLPSYDDMIYVDDLEDFYALGHDAQLYSGLEDILPKKAEGKP